MIPFEEEYKMQVELEARYIAEMILEDADEKNYEKELFASDVLRMVAKLVKEKVGG